mmetsp:Transcript_5657/g.11198  ORF Transcript_5657/g.11198 Transcript_5657/m.11198 type:complete len:303 (-) Transcript_5657:222-1130(-)
MRSLVRMVSGSSFRAMKRLQPSPQWDNPKFKLRSLRGEDDTWGDADAAKNTNNGNNKSKKVDFLLETPQQGDENNATLNVSFHVFQTVDAPSLADPVLRCMASCMCDEPASRHLAIQNEHHTKFLYPQWRAFLSPFMTEKGNYCVVAYDHGDKEVAAAFMYRDMCDGLPEESKHALNHGVFRPFLGILTEAKQQYASKTKDFDDGTRGRSGELWMRATNKKYRHHGLSEELIGLTLDEMKDHGYQKAVLQSTGDFTKRAAERNGFRVAVEIDYEGFPFEGGFPFSGTEPPHTQFWVLEKDFM